MKWQKSTFFCRQISQQQNSHMEGERETDTASSAPLQKTVKPEAERSLQVKQQIWDVGVVQSGLSNIQ